jgi:hypothetical protein
VSSSPPFPGFDHLYEMSNPHHWGAVFGARFGKELNDTIADISRGVVRPSAPPTLRWVEGRTKPGPVLWPSIAGLVMREEVAELLKENGFTGWTTYAMQLLGKDGKQIPGYHGIAVTGRCGPIDDDLCTVAMREYPVGPQPDWVGKYFAQESWDGSDFFTPEGSRDGSIFITERVKVALEKARVSNVFFETLDTVVRVGMNWDRPFPADLEYDRPPQDMYMWPERDETLGSATFTIQRGWREYSPGRVAGPVWTYYEIQRPPDQRWDHVSVNQMEFPERVDISAARVAREEWQTVVDGWKGTYFGVVEDCTPIEADELGGEFAWRWTVRGRYKKKPYVGLCYVVIIPERLFWLRGLGPCQSVGELDPAVDLMLKSFRVASEPNELARETVGRQRAVAEAAQALPAPRRDVPALKPVLSAWRRAADAHSVIGPPATDAAIDEVESSLGFSLPSALRALYEVADGLELLGGNLNVSSGRRLIDDRAAFALGGENEHVTRAELPELLVFGDDGSETYYALWLSSVTLDDPPVLMIDGGSGTLAVAATSLIPFLKVETAYYCILLEVDNAALDALSVPKRLRKMEPDDDLALELKRWADPTLADPAVSPFDRPLTIQALRTHFGSA